MGWSTNKLDSSITLDTLFRLTYDLRKNGKVIGFTHGAFDLFHCGHLHLLTESKKQCDFMIVAVDSNDKIPIYKSVRRPIIDENERLQIINQLCPVSTAFINHLPLSDDAFAYLYKELHINFLSIGRNFGAEEAVKSRTSKENIPLIKIETDLQSTSSIIHKIVNECYKADTYNNLLMSKQNGTK